MSFTPKRKRDDADPDTKKSRNDLDKPADYTTSDEWPVYNHPDGGIVKITPWGSLRQFTNPVNGEMVTKFEDLSFSDYSFDPSNTDVYDVSQYESLPSTPQSLYNNHQYHQNPRSNQNGNPNIRLSPNSEAESYVVDGYKGITPPPQNSDVHQFEQEQENYFGMNDQHEEFDYNDEVVRHYTQDYDEDVAM
ncbi:predicted protein [Scheffersomyces stipitis CBS 6054]|uniref:Uncharacterized protein n=1 Tax=Scheffersomyces stipitis (strain ATCC 58785 / CBS 6054 / NBRC 10063 / NRRL Y-11545) TaxID=322104 RepID=A3LY34_PICST|nr:predicted protein [Scheffersomyces stipitis CBS 6054]ABN67908.1 predicted protein [Scheffersomyces stipitis CBS 6054]KAG2732074.1 hypothetical protein G9P44_004491 [Scheffersomyces stipitis]